jgi:hypothetical protein
MTRPGIARFGILGAAALVASALASPAMAQEVVTNPGYCAQFYPNANCQNKGPGNPYTGSYQRQQNWQDQGYRQDRRWRDSYNRYDNDSGFWPGDVAAGVVGGAVGTAAAVATAPFAARPIGGDNYARLNGFVCTPGTMFRGEDGRRHLCQ